MTRYFFVILLMALIGVAIVVKAGITMFAERQYWQDVADRFDLSRLPDDASAMVRIVHVGDYDECLCVGAHVENTSQIGHFRISSARFSGGVQSIVFRLDEGFENAAPKKEKK